MILLMMNSSFQMRRVFSWKYSASFCFFVENLDSLTLELYSSMNSCLQQTMKMVQKKLQAAFAILGVLDPMKALVQRSMILGSCPLLSTMEALQTKNLLLMPMKSSRRQQYWSIFEIWFIWRKRVWQNLMQTALRYYVYCSFSQKTVMAISNRQAQEQIGQRAKDSRTVEYSGYRNQVKFNFMYLIIIFTNLTILSTQGSSSLLSRLGFLSVQRMQGKARPVNWVMMEMQAVFQGATSCRTLMMEMREYISSLWQSRLQGEVADWSSWKRQDRMEGRYLWVSSSQAYIRQITPLTMLQLLGYFCMSTAISQKLSFIIAWLCLQPTSKVSPAQGMSIVLSKQVEVRLKSSLMKLTSLALMVISPLKMVRKVFLRMVGMVKFSLRVSSIQMEIMLETCLQLPYISSMDSVSEKRQTSRQGHRNCSALVEITSILLYTICKYSTFPQNQHIFQNMVSLFYLRLKISQPERLNSYSLLQGRVFSQWISFREQWHCSQMESYTSSISTDI